MTKSRIFISSLCAVSLLGLSACVTDPNTGQQKVSRTAIGGGCRHRAANGPVLDRVSVHS